MQATKAVLLNVEMGTPGDVVFQPLTGKIGGNNLKSIDNEMQYSIWNEGFWVCITFGFNILAFIVNSCSETSVDL